MRFFAIPAQKYDILPGELSLGHHALIACGFLITTSCAASEAVFRLVIASQLCLFQLRLHSVIPSNFVKYRNIYLGVASGFQQLSSPPWQLGFLIL